MSENIQQYFYIPMNEKGVKNSNYGIMNDDEVITHEIPHSEFMEMYENNLLDLINSKIGTLLDYFELDIIPLNKCAETLEILRQYGYGDSLFAVALKEAMNYGTFVKCDF